MTASGPGKPRLSYREAGVDLDAARRHTEGIAELVRGGVTGFAGALPLPQMIEPMLVTCTDGVGTKLILATQLGRTEGLGQDLVAMCVNDLICTGAKPVAFLDYLAVGRLDPDAARRLVAGIADACAVAGCALLGGETAELPGLYKPEEFDLAGFACGVVERAEMLGPERVVAGDLIVGLPSSGLHANGFTLVRALIAEGALVADPELLLTPTRIYSDDMARLRAARIPVHAAAHITGGGLPENLPRALPDGLRAALDPAAWSVGPANQALLATGRVASEDAWTTFNMGIGMCLLMPEAGAAAAVAMLRDAAVIGWVEAGAPGVRFV